MTTFLDLPQTEPDQATVVVFPLPWEGTVSYGAGTARGPTAILEASTQVELFDAELGVDLSSAAVHTADPVFPAACMTPAEYLASVESTARQFSKPILALGGEHSLTPPLVRAAVGGDDLFGVTVVQIDAHTDLRDSYDGTPLSHACAMRRLTDAGASLIAVGVRASCREEIEYAAANDRVTLFPAASLHREPGAWPTLLERLTTLSGDLYVTVDVDGLDPALCPGTGTPEPGGLAWWPMMELLEAVLVQNTSIRLIGADVVEAVPQAGTQVNEFTAARLATKILACLSCRA